MTGPFGLPFSPEARLSEIRMRIDGLGSHDLGALLVEGPDDKRLFLPFAEYPSLVIPCGGRTRLLQMYDLMSDDDHSRMLPVTDCDYEVARGTLKGGPDIVITQSADVEADMLNLGLLSKIVAHVMPQVLTSMREMHNIAEEILGNATYLSLPLGRARMAAQPLGIPLSLEDFRYGKHRLKDGSPDVEKIIRTVHGQVREVVNLNDFRALYYSTPDERFMCKGADLIAACCFILKEDYKIRTPVNSDALELILRACMGDINTFSGWSACKRIRQWEKRNSRRILTNSIADS